VAQDDVAPALPHDGEAVALERRDDLRPREGREPRGSALQGGRFSRSG